MPLPDKIDEYISSLCEQIRWKRAHLRVSKEMRDHLEDGRNAYIREGLDELEATEKAITDTGDVMELGTQFDRIHRPKPQWGMMFAIAGFLAFGLFVSVFVFGHDVADSGRWLIIPGVNVPNRVFWTLVGVAVMFVAYFTDFTFLGRSHPLSICVVALLWAASTMMEPVRFSQINFFLVQGLALMLPLAFARVIFWARNKGYWGIFACGLGYGMMCLAALIMPSIAGFIHFVLIGVILFLVAVWRNWFGVNKVFGSLMVTIPFVLCTVAAFVFAQGFRSVRLAAVFNPDADPMGFGFAATQARRILGGAAMLGEGAIDTASLPAAHSDFMLTSLVSLWGWIPFAAIISVIALFIVAGFVQCFKQRSGLGFLVSFAVMLTFAVQTVMYIVYNLGFVLAQISLPLISPGNSAMIVNLGLLGFMLSVFRSGHVAADDNAIANHKDDEKFISWENGKLIITTRKVQ